MSCPTFDEAVGSFQQFLESEGWPTEIQWAEPRHFKWQSGVLKVQTSDVADARGLYEAGQQAGLGVLLNARCTIGGFTCASVERPKDETEAEALMYPSDGGLKLSVAVPRIEGQQVALPNGDG